MFQLTRFVFLLLLAFPPQSLVEGFSDISSLRNRDKSDDFAECVFQNIAETPAFPQQDKEYIKLTVETLMAALSTKTRTHGEKYDAQLKIKTANIALSVGKISTSNNEMNRNYIITKSGTLAKALEVCCRISEVCTNQDFFANIQNVIREHAIDVAFKEYVDKAKSFSKTKSGKHVNSFIKKKRRSVASSESNTIGDEDIQNCVSAVRDNLDNDDVFASCNGIFNRGFWDEKADRTLDGDIQKLMTAMYDCKSENLEMVLNFVDKHVPRYVRELIISYHTVIDNLQRCDSNLAADGPYFLRIKDAVGEIKSMNGNHYAEKYFFAKQIHKNMLEDMSINLQVAETGESVSITEKNLQDCADSVKNNLSDEPKVLSSCKKIFYRGVWDDKADRTLDNDIRKLITLIYDGNSENLAKVMYFVKIYVPKNVREIIVSCDSIINESESNGNLNMPNNRPYLLEIRDMVNEAKYMNDDHPARNYEMAKQIHKDMLGNILNNLNVPEGEDFADTDDDIQNCANSAKLDLGNEAAVRAFCDKIFDRDVTDDTIDGDIRKLISLIYDDKSENMPRILYFIQKYGPKSVRERIVIYDTIINEFQKSGDLKLPSNQPYFAAIENAMKGIEKMNGNPPAENYEQVEQIYKDMLENKLRTFAEKESTTITDEDINNCANSVQLNLEDDSKILESCAHIFNRGVWDDKADATLDGDIVKLIPLICDGEKENTVKALYFIDKYVPKHVRELIVSYDALIREFASYDDFNENQPYFVQIYETVAAIRDMEGDHPADQYSLALQKHKDMLENMMKKLHAIKKE